jgi:hypothetical protein
MLYLGLQRRKRMRWFRLGEIEVEGVLGRTVVVGDILHKLSLFNNVWLFLQ